MSDYSDYGDAAKNRNPRKKSEGTGSHDGGCGEPAAMVIAVTALTLWALTKTVKRTRWTSVKP